MTYKTEGPDLHIILTPKEQEDLLARKLEDEPREAWDGPTTEADVMEALVNGSGLTWIDPYTTGDLTAAPMLAMLGDLTRLSECENVPHVVTRRSRSATWVQPILKQWTYTPYQVRSFLDDLAEQGFCVFNGNDQEQKDKS